MKKTLKEANKIVSDALASQRKENLKSNNQKNKICLIEPQAKELLNIFGINMPEMKLTATIEDAQTTAKAMGFPVALKVVSPDIVHKSDAGGVETKIKDIKSLKTCYENIINNVKTNLPDAVIKGILVEKMAPVSTELIIGALKDPQFGPVVMFGLGGIFVEAIGDVSFRLAPINEREALDMIKETKAFPILNGFRSKQALDIYTAAKTVLSVSKIITKIDHIEEIDLNPVLVYPNGIVAVDAKIILA